MESPRGQALGWAATSHGMSGPGGDSRKAPFPWPVATPTGGSGRQASEWGVAFFWGLEGKGPGQFGALLL